MIEAGTYMLPNPPAIPSPIPQQQPPVPMPGAPSGQPYNGGGAYYAGPPASSGWAPPQPMGMQMPMQNYPYTQQGPAPPGPPGTLPPGSNGPPGTFPQQPARPPYSQ